MNTAAWDLEACLTMVDADTIEYEATIEDPKVFTRPWTMALRFERDKGYGNELELG